MTDIEQRAHDIAVAMLPHIIKLKAENNDKVSVCEEYIKAYSAYLQYLSEHSDQLKG